ncbi:calcium-binding protein [Meridianimarinicoccus aquatilis]|uniref:Calcium-binding protein n=1 Tax=Meridianimarinicoccus aquatilis TaxID=2552766 RepID=A0A4R6B2R0_9RHOB|nr:calcium-binding protein [Fluviibacterium aquatile]TDL90485.1 calcium-binding protein [Fluviibacterium aquatile]
MPLTQTVYEFLGTSNQDTIADGFENDQGVSLIEAVNKVDWVNGRQGDDTISTGLGNDLAAGDMVGDEWSFNGEFWVFDITKLVVSDYGLTRSYNDVIVTGMGDDVLLGNGGHDSLFAGAGNDILNAGRGNDRAFGEEGNDILNLEDGDDYAEGGLGDDIVNGGAGNDVIYGDNKGDNLLSDTGAAATTFGALEQAGAWTMTDDLGNEAISHSAQTLAGETYTISFELAANLAGGKSSAAVEVIWNGEVVDTVETVSGAYQTFEVDVVSTGEEGALTFRAVEASDGKSFNFDGPIVSYDKDVTVGGEEVTVSAFAAGQAKLYQVIDGHLHIFDTESKSYTEVGTAPNFKINAVGFNVEDDLIYGVAKSNGTDSLGNAVSNTDIVMIDADGATYRVGDGFYADYVGDFDDAGNLWTFHSKLNRISVVDVDDRDADGNPAIKHFHFPTSMFTSATYDLAYSAAANAFYAVVAPNKNGGDGKVVKIDVSNVEDGGQPTFSEIAITGTLYGTNMENGMAKGAYGAVFFDGEGNLYYGMNNGDHDLDISTGSTGGIFKVNADWDAGTAYSEFMSEAPATGSNDGAVDPRSADAFAEIDAEAAVLLREPVLTLVEGGNDTLRGGEGNDEIHGNEGDDDLNGGSGDDSLYGDQGNDIVAGANGDDAIFGGAGNDKLRGEAGNDAISGGFGQDYLDGGTGNDTLNGGDAADKLVGGTGSDVIEGGSGDDQLWGGNWSADGDADTFVFKAGDGKDFVHDFEADLDILDLSAYNTDLETAMCTATDQGWATIMDLSKLEGAAEGDKLILKSVELADLGHDNFIF